MGNFPFRTLRFPVIRVDTPKIYDSAQPVLQQIGHEQQVAFRQLLVMLVGQ